MFQAANEFSNICLSTYITQVSKFFVENEGNT